MAYQYDVFISYARIDPMLTWVRNHFCPMLTNELRALLSVDPQVFIDRDIPTGALWRSTLIHSLRASKVLVPVLSPSYFRSRWCRAECDAFRERPAAVGGRHRLVQPIKFADGKHFPAFANEWQHRDFSEWTYVSPAFSLTPAHVELERAVRVFAAEIAAVVEASDFPAFDPHYTIRDPDDADAPGPAPAVPRM